MTKKMTLSKKRVALILGIVAVLAIGGFLVWKTLTAKQTVVEAPAATIKVAVIPVESKTLFREDQLPAEIEAYQDVLIYPKVPGFIKWIGVDRGSVVRKGDLMVTMYAPEYLASRNDALGKVAAARAAVAAEESKLEDVQADLKKRQANLLADQSTYQRVSAASLVPGVIADNDVVQWAQTVEVDRQDVNMLIKRVNATAHEVSMVKEEYSAKEKAYDNFADMASYLQIAAPFNGYVTERKMHVGSFVGPDGSGAYPPICRVKQLDLLRIVAPVPEKDTAGVIVGSEVPFSVSTFPGQKFVGTVARISNSLDKATRTMPVELNFFNPGYKILPGMFCEVYWPTRRHQATLFVPISAVVSTPLDTFVCKIEDDIVDWVSVRKGQVMNNMVEVFGDLKEGDLVAREASDELQDESRVEATTPRSNYAEKPSPPTDVK